ncbi:MAG: aminotransferase class V-fold PLP-dependent enzyme, partial [Rubrobacteraceae bacterium]
MYDVEKVRKDFPILERRIGEKKLVYLDNAATSQKPRQVIETLTDYYEQHNANIHRGAHLLAEEATAAYEEAREKVARFLGAPDSTGLIFTRGTTESINLVAYAWGRKNLREGDEIVLTEAEHHSNLVPW